MTASPIVERELSAALSFDAPVARHLVHRWALSEVFLTDVRADASGYQAAACLPAAHSYFADQPPRLGLDPMLSMECARQAATYIAHQHLGVPHGSMFLVADWSYTVPRELLTDEAAARLRAPAQRPGLGRLTMSMTVTPQVRSDVVRGARFDVLLWLDGEPAGEMTINARYTPAGEADLVRRYHRKTAPPLSPTLPVTPTGVALPPASVGRTRDANVVLFDAQLTSEHLRARLGTVPAHRGFYDHPQDHYPAMILLEAAGQAAVAHTGGRVGGYRAAFHRFAELDEPVLVTAVADGSDHTHVTFVQADTVVARITVPLLATADGAPR